MQFPSHFSVANIEDVANIVVSIVIAISVFFISPLLCPFGFPYPLRVA